jgi:deoxyribonuclease-1
MKKLILLILLFFPLLLKAEDQIPLSFSTSTKWMLEKVYGLNPYTFYCGCEFTPTKTVIYKECGYAPKNPDSVRSRRVEAEHIVTASELGGGLLCYGSERHTYSDCVDSNGRVKSGRSCCLKVNPEYRKAHNDLVNLVPAIGEINNARLNKPFGLVNGEAREFGACDFEVNNYRAEFREDRTGEVARIRLYMLLRYGNALKMNVDYSTVQQLLYDSTLYPPTQEEIGRNLTICKVQGSGNLLVSNCL